MDLMSGIITFIIVWWMVFLMALPFAGGLETNPDAINIGDDAGAPAKSYIKIKVVVTTLIAIILWIFIDYILSLNLIDIRELAK